MVKDGFLKGCWNGLAERLMGERGRGWAAGAVSLPEGDGSWKRAREIADGVDRFQMGDPSVPT